jgi:hypothetical protein
MGQRKTSVQVQTEIEELKGLLPKLPGVREGIRAALRVLEERLTHDNVYDIFQEDTEAFEDANSARMWRDGDSSGDALSIQWKELL